MKRPRETPLNAIHIGHVGAQKGIGAEEGGNNREGRTDNPPGGLQQQDQEDEPYDDVNGVIGAP